MRIEINKVIGLGGTEYTLFLDNRPPVTLTEQQWHELRGAMTQATYMRSTHLIVK